MKEDFSFRSRADRCVLRRGMHRFRDHRSCLHFVITGSPCACHPIMAAGAPLGPVRRVAAGPSGLCPPAPAGLPPAADTRPGTPQRVDQGRDLRPAQEDRPRTPTIASSASSCGTWPSTGASPRRPAAGTALAAAGRPRHAELAVSSRRSITLACQPFRETGGMLSEQT